MTVQRPGSNDLHQYVIELEDAALAFWHELTADQVEFLREQTPRLMDFMAHLHDHVEHYEAMVRRNVWAEPDVQHIDGTPRATDGIDK